MKVHVGTRTIHLYFSHETLNNRNITALSKLMFCYRPSVHVSVTLQYCINSVVDYYHSVVVID